jgi:crotonobetainyl-CoA:carnitine CoA-transferase CaiB-like acyl-CoA transferase
MTDAMLAFAWYGLAEGFATGRFPGAGENLLAGGSPRYGLYATADGRFLAVGALEDKFWGAFCAGIGLEDGLRDDAASPEATRAAVAAILRSRPAAEWGARLEPLDCCCTVVASLEEALADPHLRGRGLVAARALAADGASIPLAAVPVVPGLRRPPGEARPVPPADEDAG